MDPAHAFQGLSTVPAGEPTLDFLVTSRAGKSIWTGCDTASSDTSVMGRMLANNERGLSKSPTRTPVECLVCVLIAVNAGDISLRQTN